MTIPKQEKRGAVRNLGKQGPARLRRQKLEQRRQLNLDLGLVDDDTTTVTNGDACNGETTSACDRSHSQFNNNKDNKGREDSVFETGPHEPSSLVRKGPGHDNPNETQVISRKSSLGPPLAVSSIPTEREMMHQFHGWEVPPPYRYNAPVPVRIDFLST